MSGGTQEAAKYVTPIRASNSYVYTASGLSTNYYTHTLYAQDDVMCDATTTS